MDLCKYTVYTATTWSARTQAEQWFLCYSASFDVDEAGSGAGSQVSWSGEEFMAPGLSHAVGN